MPSIVALISGITATGILLTGYVTGLGCFNRYRTEEADLLLWSGLILFCLGTFYLGTVVSFFQLLLTGLNIEPAYRGAQLCYTIAPVGSAICTYTGFTMFGKRKVGIWGALVHLATGIVYWYGLWGQPALTIATAIPDEVGGGLVDFELLSYVMGLTIFYLASLLVVLGGGFFWLAKNTTGAVRKKSIYLSVGCVLFCVSGAIDALVELAYFIAIPRFFMITGAILLYFGFVHEVKAGDSEATDEGKKAALTGRARPADPADPDLLMKTLKESKDAEAEKPASP